MKNKVWRRAAFAAGMLALSALVHATPVTWVLNDITFSNDGPTPVTAKGRFTYDTDTNSFSNVRISTTQGNFTNATVYTRACTDVGCPVVSSASDILFTNPGYSADMTGAQALRIELSAPMTNAGGTLGADSVTQVICQDFACFLFGSGMRVADPGATLTVETAAAPLTTLAPVPTLDPWGLMLLASVLGGLTFRRLRHRH